MREVSREDLRNVWNRSSNECFQFMKYSIQFVYNLDGEKTLGFNTHGTIVIIECDQRYYVSNRIYRIHIDAFQAVLDWIGNRQHGELTDHGFAVKQELESKYPPGPQRDRLVDGKWVDDSEAKREGAVTVAEVIEMLKGYDPEMNVVVLGYEDGLDDFQGVELVKVKLNVDEGDSIQGRHQPVKKDPDEICLLIEGHFDLSSYTVENTNAPDAPLLK